VSGQGEFIGELSTTGELHYHRRSTQPSSTSPSSLANYKFSFSEP
ncbi:hypothetical protein SOVF_186770 isoform B, partial [Spinacia oleracea]